MNGSASTHWAQFMASHGSKHPRFSKGNCYEHMADLRPALNQQVTERMFQRMIPEALKGKKVKVYGSEETQPLTLRTVHNLGQRDLNKFAVEDLWKLIDPRLKVLQPWVDEDK